MNATQIDRAGPGVAFMPETDRDMTAVAASCINRLRRLRLAPNLCEICAVPATDRARACGRLNSPCLQGGPSISRSHPATANDGWFGYRHGY